MPTPRIIVMPVDQFEIALPTMTSHETLVVRDWITTDAQRRTRWSQTAKELVLKFGMETAAHYLSALLSDAVMIELATAEGLGHTLMEGTMRRVNFFEIAVGLLKPYDRAGYFEPAPVENLEFNADARFPTLEVAEELA